MKMTINASLFVTLVRLKNRSEFTSMYKQN